MFQLRRHPAACGHPRRAIGAAALVLALSAAPAAGLDGTLGFKQSEQDGGTGAEDYRLQLITRDAYAQQLIGLWPGLSLRLEAQVRDEETQSRVGGSSTAWSQLSRRAGLGLRYGGQRLRLDLSGSGRRREQRPDPGAAIDQDIGQLGAWGQLRALRWLELQGSLLETRAWREEGALPEIETRESLRSGGVESSLPLGSLRYSYSRQAGENLARASESVHTSHLLAYEGGFGLPGERGRLSVSARTRQFAQTLRQREQKERLLLEPLGAGVRIDATPAVQDPLEAPLTPVPGLIDLDRRAATGVDLGDDAEVGLQLGGDYRNLQLDLGAPLAVGLLRVFVDRRPTAPALMRWSIWVAEDAEGQLWRELQPTSASYREWDEGLQGWEFGLPSGSVGRFFKLVDSKLGPVEPVLFVTELEAADESLLPAGERRETSRSHRGQLGLDLRLSRDWRARADLGLRRREFGGARGDQDELTQGLGLYWTRGAWSASGRLERRWLTDADADRRDSDVSGRSLSLTRRLAGLHSLGLSAEQTQDSGRDTDRLSSSLSLWGEWQLAPALRIDQRLSHGWLDDERQDLRSRSLTSFTALHCAPFAWLFLEFSRIDRWVEREAQVGYTRFNDTALTLGWTPVPLISWRSHIVHEERGEGEWLVTHSLSWTPLPGGDLALRLNANQFSDTRVGSEQASAGLVLSWTPRPRLLLEGGLESQRLDRPEGDSSPVNSFLRTRLAF